MMIEGGDRRRTLADELEERRAAEPKRPWRIEARGTSGEQEVLVLRVLADAIEVKTAHTMIERRARPHWIPFAAILSIRQTARDEERAIPRAMV